MKQPIKVRLFIDGPIPTFLSPDANNLRRPSMAETPISRRFGIENGQFRTLSVHFRTPKKAFPAESCLAAPKPLKLTKHALFQ